MLSIEYFQINVILYGRVALVYISSYCYLNIVRFFANKKEEAI